LSARLPPERSGTGLKPRCPLEALRSALASRARAGARRTVYPDVPGRCVLLQDRLRGSSLRSALHGDLNDEHLVLIAELPFEDRGEPGAGATESGERPLVPDAAIGLASHVHPVLCPSQQLLDKAVANAQSPRIDLFGDCADVG